MLINSSRPTSAQRCCVFVCVCVRFHGRERIGHAQLVVAAVGVYQHLFPSLEQTYVPATLLPVGILFVRYFHFNHRTVTA